MENQVREDEVEIDLLELFQVLLGKIGIIIVSLIIGAGLLFSGPKFLITPQYSSTSMIYILTKTTSVTSLADIQMGSQLTKDFAILATSRPVVKTVIDELDLEYSYEEMVAKVTVDNPADTRYLKITVEDPDPELAADMANAFADATADGVAEIMSTDRPSIVERAVVPKVPSSPSLVKNTAIGGVIAALLVMAVIVVRYLLDDTIKTEEDVTKYLQLNTLASLPLDSDVEVKKGTRPKNGTKSKKQQKKPTNKHR